jgi:hypothetical protein
MCPACLASAGLIVGSVISTGGLTALIVKMRAKKAANRIELQMMSEEKKS